MALNKIEGKKYIRIDDITPLTENSCIKVRIIRYWKTPKFVNPQEVGSLEMVLLDEQGGRIQASVKSALVRKFEYVLKEFQICLMSNFGVGQNNGAYKATNHRFKINFFFGTCVRVCDELPIPKFGFNLVSLQDILMNKLDDSVLIDVVGQIVGVGQLESNEKNGKISKRITVDLNDTKGTKLRCTLWDEYALKIADFIGGNTNGPLIVIIQLAKIKEWRGQVMLSNALFSTEFHLDSTIPEIQYFRESVEKSMESSCVSRPIELSSQTSMSIGNAFLHIDDKRSIDEIREIDKPGFCICLAEILCIQLEHNWYYLACKKCTKKVKPDDEIVDGDNGQVKVISKFYCSKCSRSVGPQHVIPRFKVQVRVVDDTGSASFVIFDREVSAIINKTTYVLKESLVEDEGGDCYPEELNMLTGKRFLFKVEVSDYNLQQNWPVYTVSKMTNDEDVINTYLRSIDKNQDSNNIEDTSVDKDSLSCMGDNEQISDFSPIQSTRKRILEDDTVDVGMQQSATRNVVIKVEKDDN